MNKIISLFIISSLCLAGIVLFENAENTDNEISLKESIDSAQNTSISYNNYIKVNQEDIQLEREVVQFEILFHQDDVVDVYSSMYVYYVDETITSVYCLLTDGEKSLLEPTGGPFFVPERKFLLLTPRRRLSVGKLWLIKFLNEREGKLLFGSPWNASGQFTVQKGDRWYLTLAVPTSAEKTGFSVVFSSKQKSMEINQLVRHDSLGLYTLTYNQFSGKYIAIKVSLLGGFCVCDISKEITTNDGSIIEMYVVGYRKANLHVTSPTGEKMQFDRPESIGFRYWGNQTGTWNFRVKGWSLRFLMGVMLLYIDIDPHADAPLSPQGHEGTYHFDNRLGYTWY